MVLEFTGIKIIKLALIYLKNNTKLNKKFYANTI